MLYIELMSLSWSYYTIDPRRFLCGVCFDVVTTREAYACGWCSSWMHLKCHLGVTHTQEYGALMQCPGCSKSD